MEELTKRERAVLHLVVRGLTNREIEKRLHMSPNMVKKAVSALLDKLGCRTRAGITLVAIERGLVPDISKTARHPKPRVEQSPRSPVLASPVLRAFLFRHAAPGETPTSLFRRAHTQLYSNEGQRNERRGTAVSADLR